MIRVFIIEDEAPACERLFALLTATAPACAVVGTANSLAAARKWLRSKSKPLPDLIFAGAQLGDGLALDFFKSSPAPCPVIFTTPPDGHLPETFAAQNIAYLSKPVQSGDLEAAVRKYHQPGRPLATQAGR